MGLSLRLYPPLLLGLGASRELAPDILGYTRSIRGRGGYWIGEFQLTGPQGDLVQIFYDSLGGHFEERSGGLKTWEGMVWEMDLTYKTPGVRNPLVATRRRSLDLMYNYVYGKTVDQAGTEYTITAASQAQSIARYGRREEYLLLNNQGQTEANNRRDTYLSENAWPWARVASISQALSQQEAVLDIAVLGYIHTANWRYRTAGDGSTANVSTFISEILTADCATFLTPGRITTNTLQVTKGSNTPVRAGDLLVNLVDLGDGTDPWWLQVGNGRSVLYEKIPASEPLYYLRGGEIFATSGGSKKVDPWQIKPGVYRDITYPVRSNEFGGWLAKANDFYVSEVEVGTHNGLVLKTDAFEESDLLAANAEYRARLEGQGTVAGAEGEERSRLNWRRRWAKQFSQLGVDPWELKAGDEGFAAWKKDLLKRARARKRGRNRR